jgi:DHA1 family multidrug resistance protein-like MFS transporter
VKSKSLHRCLFAVLFFQRIVFLSSIGLWTIWHVGAARANNIATLTVTRAFAGLMGTASLVNGASVATDVAQGLVVAKGIALYCTFVFLGPVIGREYE